MKAFFKVFGALICILSFSFQSFSQQKLVLLNGKVLQVQDVHRADNKIFYKTSKQPEKEKSMTEFRVFSIENMGIEQLVYFEDTTFEDGYTVEQMRMFVEGQKDAREKFKPTFISIGSVLVGAGAAPFAIWGLAAPAIYTQVAGAINPNMEKQEGANKAYLSSEDYVEGYMKRARDMKIQRTLMYGYSGFVLGVAGLIIFIAD